MITGAQLIAALVNGAVLAVVSVVVAHLLRRYASTRSGTSASTTSGAERVLVLDDVQLDRKGQIKPPGWWIERHDDRSRHCRTMGVIV